MVGLCDGSVIVCNHVIVIAYHDVITIAYHDVITIAFRAIATIIVDTTRLHRIHRINFHSICHICGNDIGESISYPGKSENDKEQSLKPA